MRRMEQMHLFRLNFMIRFIKIFILSRFLFHANRYYFGGVREKTVFYSIKNELLERFGEKIGQDLQFIEGKECWSCEGTGLFRKHTWHGSWWESCWHCTNGMYKRAFWSLLECVKFGSFVFHRPVRRIYDPVELLPIQHIPTRFHGYISHKYTYWSESCAYLLVWYYRRSEIKHFSSGYACGRSPSRYAAKFFHIIYRGKDSIPALRFQDWKKERGEKIKNKAFEVLNYFRCRIEAFQLKLREKSEKQKEAESLTEIFDLLPSGYSLGRSYWNEFSLFDDDGKEIATDRIERIEEYLREKIKQEPEGIPF